MTFTRSREYHGLFKRSRTQASLPLSGILPQVRLTTLVSVCGGSFPFLRALVICDSPFGADHKLSRLRTAEFACRNTQATPKSHILRDPIPMRCLLSLASPCACHEASAVPVLQLAKHSFHGHPTEKINKTCSAVTDDYAIRFQFQYSSCAAADTFAQRTPFFKIAHLLPLLALALSVAVGERHKPTVCGVGICRTSLLPHNPVTVWR